MNARRKADTEECRDVCAAATALGLREIDFFRLAYRRWFGTQPDVEELDRVFADYMFRGAVPQWVRHLGREVNGAVKRGDLDSESFGAGRYRERLSRHPRGPLYFGVTVAVWLVLFAMLLDTQYDSQTSAPTAVCGRGTGSALFDHWVRLINGGPPSWCRDSGPSETE